MKIKLRLVLLCVLLIDVFYCMSIFAEENIIVGLDVNVPPMGFLSESGEIVGLDIDLAKEVFKNLGKSVTFQPIDWDAKELEINSGKIDVIWNGLSKTSEREKNMLLTRPYMKNRQVVIVNKTFEGEKLESLRGKTICVQKGSTGLEAIKKHSIKNELKQIIELESMVNCLNEVEALKADATVVDEVIAKYYLDKENQMDKFKILNQEISFEEYVVAVKKDNLELKNQIENQFSILNKSGKGEEISNKWFGENLFIQENTEFINVETNTSQAENKLVLTPIIDGTLMTLKLFLLTLTFSLPLGLIFYLLSNSKYKTLKYIIKLYSNIMRSTPLLLQLFFIFYGLSYIPIIGPYITIKDRFLAGLVTFVLNYTAYFIHIFKAGFLSVDNGQIEAAKVLGFTKSQTLLKILLPQVFRVILPTICNECVTLVKDTALIFTIGVPELLSNTKNLVNSTANISSYIIAGMIYFLICALLIRLCKRLETKFSYGGASNEDN